MLDVYFSLRLLDPGLIAQVRAGRGRDSVAGVWIGIRGLSATADFGRLTGGLFVSQFSEIGSPLVDECSHFDSSCDPVLRFSYDCDLVIILVRVAPLECHSGVGDFTQRPVSAGLRVPVCECRTVAVIETFCHAPGSKLRPGLANRFAAYTKLRISEATYPTRKGTTAKQIS